jgi:superfamily II DNA or RNA helicase
MESELPKMMTSKIKLFIKSLYNTQINHDNFSPSDCLNLTSEKSLKDYQRNIVKYFFDSNINGLLLVYSTGVGKTLVAAAVAKCFLEQQKTLPENKRGKVIFVGPKSVKDNFRKTVLENYSINPITFNTYYKLFSFEQFMYKKFQKREIINCSNDLFIIDEAHNIRNYRTDKDKQPKNYEKPEFDYYEGPMPEDKNIQVESELKNSESKRYSTMFDCAATSAKRLLLTATPVVTSLFDLIPLINILHGKSVVGNKSLYEKGLVDNYITNNIEESKDTLTELLQGRVDYIRKVDQEYYPEKIEKFVYVPMTKEYRDKFIEILDKGYSEDLKTAINYPGIFLNGYRKLCQKVADDYQNLKVDYILNLIDKKGTKTVIFSNWIEFGVNGIIDALNLIPHIKYATITGENTEGERKRSISDYNENKVDVLVISRAGGEGIDLKGTSRIIILDPPWHNAGLQQVIGRAIRYKSHYHLPKEYQKVYVYKMVLVEKPGMTIENLYLNPQKLTISGDVILYNYIENRKKLEESVDVLLEKISIDKHNPAKKQSKSSILNVHKKYNDREIIDTETEDESIETGTEEDSE